MIRLACLVSLACLAEAQNRRYTQDNESGGVLLPQEACYDVRRYDLALAIDPEAKRIDGSLGMDAVLLEASDEVVLDLDERLEVTSALVAGHKVGAEEGLFGVSHWVFDEVQVRREEGRVHVPLTESCVVGEPFRVQLDYGGVPREAPRPPWDGGLTWSRTADGSHWIATTCQGEGADVWWPCKDHPSDEPDSMSLSITVPRGLVVAANGRLAAVQQLEEPARTMYRWEVTTPINNYGVALNIAPYETISTMYRSIAGDEFEFTYWVLPENREKGEAVFGEFQRQMAFFEDVCGPYPFRRDKYGVAETPHLGMEHQTIIAYGHGYRGDLDLGYDYDWLHHHELSHEWWANLVSARDWKDFWIHEGVGTYMQALYLERRFGMEAYHAKMRHDLKRVKNKGAIAPSDARTTQEMYFSSNRDDAPDIDVYMKSSWVLHTMRWLVGDEKMFTTLRRWAYPDPAMEATRDGSACRFSDTAEMIAIAEQHCGADLGWFFDLYLRQPQVPRLKLRRDGAMLHLTWDTPDDLPFPMPVPVRVGDTLHRVEMPGGRGQVEVAGAEYTVDPDWWLLMDRHNW